MNGVDMKYVYDSMADLPEARRYEDLTDEEREVLGEEAGPGKWYCEGSGIHYLFEVPSCPFCGGLGWGANACEHLAVMMDLGSRKFYRLTEKLQSILEEEADLSPAERLEEVSGMKTFEETHCEWSSLFWGFLEAR